MSSQDEVAQTFGSFDALHAKQATAAFVWEHTVLPVVRSTVGEVVMRVHEAFFALIVGDFSAVGPNEPGLIGVYTMTQDCCWIAFWVAVYACVSGAITGNYSKMDQLWSVLPFIYALIATLCAVTSAIDRATRHPEQDVLGGCDRSTVACLLTLLWSLRLTFNFWRRGGYGCCGRATEDHRWPALRARMGPVAWGVFNVLFISCFQSALLLLLSVPHWRIALWRATNEGARLTGADWAITGLFLCFLVFQTVADNQQATFQRAKHATPVARRTGEAKDGFLQSGLFAFSRHPAFFAEQAMWWLLYALSVSEQVLRAQMAAHSESISKPIAVEETEGGDAAVPDASTSPALPPLRTLWNASLVGPLLLSLLFIGSTRFTEQLSAAKYPAYAAYQRRVSAVIPWFSRGQRHEHAD